AFTDADELDARNVIVISDALAASVFESESPVNRVITVNGVGYTVIGVVPRSIEYGPLRADAYTLRPSGAPAVPITYIRLAEHLDSRAVSEQLKVVAARLAIAAGEAPSTTAFVARGIDTRRFAMNDFQIGLAAAVFAVLLV